MLLITLLVISVCIDSFAASITYGISKIKIPVLCALIMNVVGASFLAISLYAAEFISSFFDEKAIKITGASLLFALGFCSLFLPFVKSIFKRCKGRELFNIDCIKRSVMLVIFLDETKADLDNSKSLSLKEALFLSAALSCDSLATGFGAGLGTGSAYYLYAVILCFFLGLLGILLGSRLGNLISLRLKSRLDLSFLSGILLIVLGVTKL